MDDEATSQGMEGCTSVGVGADKAQEKKIFDIHILGNILHWEILPP